MKPSYMVKIKIANNQNDNKSMMKTIYASYDTIHIGEVGPRVLQVGKSCAFKLKVGEKLMHYK